MTLHRVYVDFTWSLRGVCKVSCKVEGNLHKHSFGWLRGPGWMCHQLETRSPLEGGLCGRYRSRYRFLDFSRKTFVFLYPRGSKIDPRWLSDEKIKNRNRWENVWCLASPIFSTIGSVLLTLAPRGVRCTSDSQFRSSVYRSSKGGISISVVIQLYIPPPNLLCR